MAEANPMLSLDALTFHNAHAALDQGCAAVAAGETVFDLGGVKAADSSALSLMLAWQRRARAQGRTIKFINVPANVGALAKLYGVDELISHG
ncbi:STAS domain-containing protein [Massilia sp. TN1-12]|uniref:STAS domain-containing protein n=2 Tax=Massilia TaxID=149698 RepID=UPI00384EBD43